MNKPVRFVSLGGDCQPGAHIRRIAGAQEIPDVFDWLESGIEAVYRVISSNFADFFKPENLAWEWREENWLVTDLYNDIASWHHFKSQDPDHVQQVSLMFRMLGRRFMELLRSDTPVIFVRRWIALDGPNSERKAKRLHDILKSIKPDMVMLYLQEHDPRPPFIVDSYISVFNPATLRSATWTGYNALYDRNFNRARRLLEASLEPAREPMVNRAGG